MIRNSENLSIIPFPIENYTKLLFLFEKWKKSSIGISNRLPPSENDDQWKKKWVFGAQCQQALESVGNKEFFKYDQN